MLVLWQARELDDLADFDGAGAGAGDAAGDVDRFVGGVDVDQVVAAELFACLCERAVGDEPFPLADADA